MNGHKNYIPSLADIKSAGMSKQTAHIDNWYISLGCILGHIKNPYSQKDFNLNKVQVTTRIIGDITNLKEGCIVETKNTVYKLGKPFGANL